MKHFQRGIDQFYQHLNNRTKIHVLSFLSSVFFFVSRLPDSSCCFSLHYKKKTCQSHQILICLNFDNFVPFHKIFKVLLTDSSTTNSSDLVWFQHYSKECQITNTPSVFSLISCFFVVCTVFPLMANKRTLEG